jgi:SPP1 gp7 family putative phage head morphogenesis protein
MPVHKVKGGYKWGQHGHVYKSKAGAERQARAIYANGWHEDDKAIARRLALSVRPAELRYVQALRGVVRGLHRGIAAAVDPHLVAMAAHKSDARNYPHDPSLPSGPIDMGSALTHFLKQVPGKVGPLFDRMAKTVDAANATQYATLIPIKLGDVGVTGAISAAREANIRLVEDAGRAYAQDVRDVISDPSNFGLRVEELRDQLIDRGNVNESRATLIARDQTLKLNGAITEARQTSAGVDSYVWSTSQDERVRESHQELEGQRFSWDSPPEVGHPGQDFQCRCVAIPWIPEFDGTEA